jgi:hypothetical protein
MDVLRLRLAPATALEGVKAFKMNSRAIQSPIALCSYLKPVQLPLAISIMFFFNNYFFLQKIQGSNRN